MIGFDTHPGQLSDIRSSMRVMLNRLGLTVHFVSESTLAVNTFPICSLYGSTQTRFAYAKTREKR